jgi:hypothetical protein
MRSRRDPHARTDDGTRSIGWVDFDPNIDGVNTVGSTRLAIQIITVLVLVSSRVPSTTGKTGVCASRPSCRRNAF